MVVEADIWWVVATNFNVGKGLSFKAFRLKGHPLPNLAWPLPELHKKFSLQRQHEARVPHQTDRNQAGGGHFTGSSQSPDHCGHSDNSIGLGAGGSILLHLQQICK